MPIYEYKALTTSGQTKTGILDADSPREARLKLRSDKVHVTSIRTAGDLEGRAPRGARRGKGLRREMRLPRSCAGASASHRRLPATTRQLATLLRSGIAARRAPEGARSSSRGTAGLEAVLRDVRERMTRAQTLAEALGTIRACFTPLYVNMVRAGEAAGAARRRAERLGDYSCSSSRVCGTTSSPR